MSTENRQVGTVLLIEPDAGALAHLAAALNSAETNRRGITLAIELEPDAPLYLAGSTAEAPVKVKIGAGAWTVPLGTVTVKALPLTDARN